MFDTLILILDSTVRLSTPLLLAALAGLYSERSGVFDIGLEGKMLGAAFAAGAAAAVTGSAWIGLGAGIAVSIALALVHGFACITNRGNQIGEPQQLTHQPAETTRDFYWLDRDVFRVF